MSAALPGHLRELLELLAAAAEADEVCPSHTALAAALKLGSGDHVQDWIERLVAAGFIATETVSNRRVVTILATGRRTALPPTPKQPKRGSLQSQRGLSPRAGDPPIPKERVYREACAGCGVREEVHEEHGCRQFRWAA